MIIRKRGRECYSSYDIQLETGDFLRGKNDAKVLTRLKRMSDATHIARTPTKLLSEYKLTPENVSQKCPEWCTIICE